MRAPLTLVNLVLGLTHCGSPSNGDDTSDPSGTSAMGSTGGVTTGAPATNATTGAGPATATTAAGSTSSAASDTTTAGSTNTNTNTDTTANTASASTTASTGAGGASSDSSTTGPGGSGGATATSSTSGGAPSVRFVGRIDRSDPAGERFAWSGSGLVAAFEGTRVSVSLNDASENEFTVVLDGEVLPKLAAQAGSHDYVLAESLAPGQHVVELYRRTEASFGVTQFLGFDFGEDGRLLEPPAAPARLIEVVGDSISCGYGNEGSSPDCDFTADTENHYLTYGAISARALEADVITVAWSGKGVIYNYGDDKTDPLPALYGRTLPDDASSDYDFAQIPDAVVINLGTNDFSTDGDPSPDDFETTYLDLLERIRSAYPDAFVLCTVGPLLSGEDLTAARAGIENAVATLQDQGDLRVKSWEMNIENNAPGCHYHPSVATHEAMATALTAELRSELGW